MIYQKPLLGELPDWTRFPRPVGLWLMNEGSGSIINDLSGNRNTGSLVGDTHFVPGKYGSCLDFDGTEDYVKVSRAVLTASPMTIVAWFNSNDNSLQQTIFSLGSSTSGSNFIALYAMGNSAGDPVKLARRDGGSTNYAATTTGYSANTWHQAAAVLRSASDVSVFIDGGSEGTSSTSITPTLDNTNIGVLYANGYSYYMSGLIDHVMIFDRALSADEIQDIYDAQKPAGHGAIIEPSETDLKGLASILDAIKETLEKIKSLF